MHQSSTSLSATSAQHILRTYLNKLINCFILLQQLIINAIMTVDNLKYDEAFKKYQHVGHTDEEDEALERQISKSAKRVDPEDRAHYIELLGLPPSTP